jgi:phage gp36-like protein
MPPTPTLPTTVEPPNLNAVVYATIEDIVQTAQNGWQEVAQRGCTEAVLDPDALKTLVRGEAMGMFDLDMQKLAQDAVYRLKAALDMASRHVDTYLFPKYRAYMPLKPELVRSSDLPAVVAAIALKRLYGTGLTEDMRKALSWTDDHLRDIANGKISLGTQDTAVAVAPGNTVSRAPRRAIDWSAY